MTSAKTSERDELIAEAPRNCPRCPRLVLFRDVNREAEPTWYNGAVPSFGSEAARLLIVGLAPGLRGANRTGRPFTGDYAGNLLYSTLIEFGFAQGRFEARPDDGLRLIDCMITNAVRCVPPQNKPLPVEIAACRGFLIARMRALPQLSVLVVLGRVAHEQTLAALDLRKSLFPFAHGKRHELRPGLTMFDSLHCSRLNTNTGRLTTAMFHDVFRGVRLLLGPPGVLPT
ncbi:MAG: uracil-DNA glycosylase [Hyphomicrobium sp.]|jgi:uracil-DNA glycosylase family 4